MFLLSTLEDQELLDCHTTLTDSNINIFNFIKEPDCFLNLPEIWKNTIYILKLCKKLKVPHHYSQKKKSAPFLDVKMTLNLYWGRMLPLSVQLSILKLQKRRKGKKNKKIKKCKKSMFLDSQERDNRKLINCD